MIKKFLGYFILVASMMLGACDADHNVKEPVGQKDEELVEVSFTLKPETAFFSRGGEDMSPLLGKAKKIDMLICAIYMREKELDHNGEFTGNYIYSLLHQYGEDGVVTPETVFDTESEKYITSFKPTHALDNSEALKNNPKHEGHIVMHIGNTFANEESIYLTFRLMRNQSYRFLLWAQSSETNVYNTENFENITINYTGLNNDETRDAFCKMEEFSVATQGSNLTRTIILTRPFAQINVGTTGWDYIKTFNSESPLYSKMTIAGVASRYNLLLNAILDTSSLSTVTFDWAEIPGELLWVDMDGDGNYKEYSEEEPLREEGGKTVFLTEKFKHLSMSYVLVPSEISNVTSDGSVTYSQVTLDQVKIWVNTTKTENPLHTYMVEKAPAQRNWRTNIVGGFYKKEDPQEGEEMEVKTEPGI